MIVGIQLILTAVIVYLLLDFAIQNIDSTFSPSSGILKLRKENTCIYHTLGFKQQVITLRRIILKKICTMTMITTMTNR